MCVCVCVCVCVRVCVCVCGGCIGVGVGVCMEWRGGKGGGHQSGMAKNKGRGELGGKSFHSMYVLIKGNMIL